MFCCLFLLLFVKYLGAPVLGSWMFTFVIYGWIDPLYHYMTFFDSEFLYLSAFQSIQLRPTLCNPMGCSMPGFPVYHQLLEPAQTLGLWVGDAFQPSYLYCPLLLLPSVFLSIKVFSNESVLCIRWPEYWSFNFIISPSNEYSGLISFRIDWL